MCILLIPLWVKIGIGWFILMCIMFYLMWDATVFYKKHPEDNYEYPPGGRIININKKIKKHGKL